VIGTLGQVANSNLPEWAESPSEARLPLRPSHRITPKRPCSVSLSGGSGLRERRRYEQSQTKQETEK